VQTPCLTGNDVWVYQNLLTHWSRDVPKPSGCYDADTQQATVAFQHAHGLPADGVVDPVTASLLLDRYSYDGYRDDGIPPAALGYLYKVHIPVHRNRSIESIATLYAANNTELLKFAVRCHGYDTYPYPTPVWPDFNNTNDGLNMFSSDGNTPTGLIEFDLNSPEDEPNLFGPYPVNRAVQGLKGNAAFLIPNVRDGILMHTGEWPGWSVPDVMPNSEGCIHSWPQNIETVWHLLVSLGVQVRNNTNGQLPYPYKPQGLLSVEQIDF